MALASKDVWLSFISLFFFPFFLKGLFTPSLFLFFSTAHFRNLARKVDLFFHKQHSEEKLQCTEIQCSTSVQPSVALNVYSLQAEEHEEEEDLVSTAETHQFAIDISTLLTTLTPR